MRFRSLAAVLALCGIALAQPARAQDTPQTIVAPTWVELASDGPHARTLAGNTCPDVTVDGTAHAMSVRAVPTAAFPDRVCDFVIPPRTRSASIGGRPLPLLHPIRKIVVIGDTGCVVRGFELQACDDDRAWPFPSIAAAVAGEHPDVIVHVGDLYSRETACPADFAGCQGQPHGDGQPAWMADWFGPATPMFAAAPLVLVRGDHEACDRGGAGWFRYLDTGTSLTCTPHTKPFAIQLDGLRLVAFDSSAASDTKVDAADVLEYAAEFGAARRMASGETWIVMNRPVYGMTQNASRDALVPINATLQTATNGDVLAPYEAMLAGHIDLFETLSLEGAPPVLINGMSGSRLGVPITATVKGTSIGTMQINDFDADGRFGYAVYERAATGWAVTVRNADGAVFRRCAFGNGAVHCAG